MLVKSSKKLEGSVGTRQTEVRRAPPKKKTLNGRSEKWKQTGGNQTFVPDQKIMPWGRTPCIKWLSTKKGKKTLDYMGRSGCEGTGHP